MFALGENVDPRRVIVGGFDSGRRARHWATIALRAQRPAQKPTGSLDCAPNSICLPFSPEQLIGTIAAKWPAEDRSYERQLLRNPRLTDLQNKSKEMKHLLEK